MPRLVLASVLACLLLLTGPVFAQFTFHTGNIVIYHLNSQVPNRGPCVQTLPAAPTTWICLYKTDLISLQTQPSLCRGASHRRSACAHRPSFAATQVVAHRFFVEIA